MESLKKLQDQNKLMISNAFTNFKKSPKERITESYVETRLELLENYWSSFSDTHKKIVTDVEDTHVLRINYFKTETYDVIEDTYINYKTELKQLLLKFQRRIADRSTVGEHSSQDESAGSSSQPKLPKVTIPIFSGDYTEWTSFKNLFTSLIHNNAKLDNVQKLQYLKGQLRGEPEQLLRHKAITSSNYEICWNKLCARYNDKRLLANDILKRLFGFKSLKVASSSGVKELYDTLTDCLEALEDLGYPTGQWDVIIIFLMSEKLDSDTRKEWESKANENLDDSPSLDTFKQFLVHKYRSIQFLDPKISKATSHTKSYKANVHTCTAISGSNCPLCKEEHKLINCKDFSKQDVNSRRSFVQGAKLCFNCLAPNHSVYVCRQSTRCKICKRKHHTLLHPANVSQSESSDKDVPSVDKKVALTATEAQEDTASVTACFSNTSSQILLATALVKAEARTGQVVVLRCLLDQGSQASFITESAVQSLGLKKTPHQISISGVGTDANESISSKHSVSMKLQSIHDPTYQIDVKAHVLTKLTKFLPSRKVSVELPEWSALAKLPLADPSFHTPSKIDVLLSAEIYCQILVDGLLKGPPGYPVAQNTKLGWILSGRIQSNKFDSCNTNEVVSMHIQQHDDTNELLKRFWELESDHFRPAKPILSPEEERCEEIFRTTTTRDEFGRYIVRLPFRDDDPKCLYGHSKDIATRRYLSLERRLNRDPDLKQKYTAVIQEYLDLNHMELVPEKEREHDRAVYLPHHPVIREDKTTSKVRIVFDGSCQGTNGVSLNDELLVGPRLQPDLRHIIMRWRQHKICLIADIVKMYRQVKVAPEDADFQRILWRDQDGVIQHYRLVRVTFGTASAPYLAVRTLQQLAYDESVNLEGDAKTSKGIVEKILNDYFVDDFMSGCATVEEALNIYEELNKIMAKGGFQLQKWASNNHEVLRIVGETNRKQGLEISSEKDTEKRTKVLGVIWNNVTDEIEYSVKLPEISMPITKRKVISDISRLFDPLGWIAPVIIQAKIFIQKLWLSGIDWDDQLPPNLLQEWISYRENLPFISGFRLPRWIKQNPEDHNSELHGFCDASNNAFAAVVFMRTVSPEGEVKVSLITSKTKVSPIKQVCIPRLELCGASLLAKLLFVVATTLKIPKSQVRAWTDSSVVLAWLSSHPSRWKTFVGNRVSDIISLFDRSHWAHVRSKDNPADCASRGVNPTKFADEILWVNGPTWLHANTISYSPQEGDSQDWNTTLEERSKGVCLTTIISDFDEFISRFSSLRKLLKVLAYCNRFIQLKCNRIRSHYPVYLTFLELHQILVICIKKSQAQHFAREIHSLTHNGNVNKKSKLFSLTPFLCQDGLLRVGGRLQKSELDYDTKHPILISHKCHLSRLIIAEAHEKTLHGGPLLMINYVRGKYWITNLKNQVKYHKRNCVICVRHSSTNVHPMMGQLPAERVTVTRPFLHTGCDYAGPIAVRTTKGRGHHATKGYICLFVCMTTRAIHLEAVSDMTSDAFLAAFKRFVARRGHCAELWSDNGSNFVGAARELKTLLLAEKSSVAIDITNWLSTNGTNWHRIPPHAPNFGGLWEAGIKSTKFHLKRIIGTSTLTFEELTTVLTQIEACLNSRPISQVSDDSQDPLPLTPAHFLVGESLLLPPDNNYENSNLSSLKRWQYTQQMVQSFWRRWSQEYLNHFLQRYKWNHQTPEPETGDIVLVKEDDLPPARWLYGIIVDKHPGLDKVTRVVSLRCKGTVIKRPVSKLCILPMCK